jgi:hypothetical protein
LAVVAALAAVTSSASGAAVAAGVPSCQTAGLVVWLDTNGNGTAGSIYYNLEFTNLSGHACTLRGYPGVSAIGLNGDKLGHAGSRDHGRKVKTIKLSKGATAETQLRIVDAGALSSCHLTTAAGLRIFPPNQTASTTVPFPFEACSGSGPSVLIVQAVHS